MRLGRSILSTLSLAPPLEHIMRISISIKCNRILCSMALVHSSSIENKAINSRHGHVYRRRENSYNYTSTLNKYQSIDRDDGSMIHTPRPRKKSRWKPANNRRTNERTDQRPELIGSDSFCFASSNWHMVNPACSHCCCRTINGFRSNVCLCVFVLFLIDIIFVFDHMRERTRWHLVYRQYDWSYPSSAPDIWLAYLWWRRLHDQPIYISIKNMLPLSSCGPTKI